MYRLTHSQLTRLDRIGDKSAYNILDELAKTRTIPLSKFLHALGIERIGPMGSMISQHFTSLHNLLDWVDTGTIEELTVIDGIGEKVAMIFKEGIAKRIDLITEYEIIQVENEEKAATGVLDGMSFSYIQQAHFLDLEKEIALAIKTLEER